MWKIKSLTERDDHGHPMYWSNDVGWTWKDFSDTFTTEEMKTVLLPFNGIWEEQI